MLKRYSTKEASALLKSWGISFSPGTLEVWRSRNHKKGPAFVKIRSKVYYTEESLKKFAEGFEVKTTDSVMP